MPLKHLLTASLTLAALGLGCGGGDAKVSGGWDMKKNIEYTPP